MTKLTEAEFRDRLERAFDPFVVRPLTDPTRDLDRGSASSVMSQNDEARLFAELDALKDLENFPPPSGPLFTAAEYDETPEKLPLDRAYTSRYDRLVLDRIKLEEAVAELGPEHPDYHFEMARLAEVRFKIKVELERAKDDQFRKFERVDEWRMNNKAEYNASRRLRERPNQMTPKAVLAAETPEQKKERLRQRDRQRKAEKRAMIRAQRDAAGLDGSTST